MDTEVIRAYNEGYNQGREAVKEDFIAAMRVMSRRIDELEEKHWSECMQIAQYDDELRQTKDKLIKLRRASSF